MSDIVDRLRHWSHGLTYDPAAGLMHEAADKIERLRDAIRRLAEQDATLSVQGGNVTVTMDATLTDEERKAIEEMLYLIATQHEDYGKEAQYLRKLLERLS